MILHKLMGSAIKSIFFLSCWLVAR